MMPVASRDPGMPLRERALAFQRMAYPSSELLPENDPAPGARPPPRVLLLGMIPTLTWAVARCLNRAGMRPVVLGWHRLSPLALIRDCAAYVPLRNVRWIDGELDIDLIHQVEEAARVHQTDLVMPADYDAILLLARGAGQLGRARLCAMPDYESLIQLHHKYQLTRLMDRLGIPYPATELAANPEELVRTRLDFPIITKPPNDSASVGFQIHHAREELVETLTRGKLEAPYPLLVQQFIPGWDVGFSFLARRGQLVAYSISEHKQDGQRRFYEDDRLRAHLQTLLAATRYSGVGHFDGRYDPERDEYRILELNPRFWGSLLYSTNAGVNYPELLARLDDLPPATFQTARPGEIVLPPYERTVGIGMKVTERVHHGALRMLGI
jgi:predicted ATP-grasp superfamily ATP-dependent carboligase